MFRNVVYYMQRLMEVYEEVVLNKKCRSRGLEVVEGAGPVGPVPRRAACRFRRRGPARSVVVSTLGTRSAVTSPAAPAQGPPAPYYCTSFGTLWTRSHSPTHFPALLSLLITSLPIFVYYRPTPSESLVDLFLPRLQRGLKIRNTRILFRATSGKSRNFPSREKLYRFWNHPFGKKPINMSCKLSFSVFFTISNYQK